MDTNINGFGRDTPRMSFTSWAFKYRWVRIISLIAFVITILSSITIIITVYLLLLVNEDFNSYAIKSDWLNRGISPGTVCQIQRCKFVFKYESTGTRSYYEYNTTTGRLVRLKSNVLEDLTFLKALNTFTINALVAYAVLDSAPEHTNKHQYILDYNYYIDAAANTLTVVGIFFFIICSLFCLYIERLFTEKSKIERSVQRNKLMVSQQVELVESLHHELAAPTQAIRNVVEDLTSNVFPCKCGEGKVCANACNKICYSMLNIEDLEPPEACKNKYIPKSMPFNDKIITAYKVIDSSVTSQLDVLTLLNSTKDIKRHTYPKSLLLIIKNAANLSNLVKVYKVKHAFNNTNKLQAIKTKPDEARFKIGILANTIVALCNNATEAGATHITFDVELIEGCKDSYCIDMVSILVKDNGRGIRNTRNGEIMSKKELEDIFTPMFSTKTDTNEHIIVKRSTKTKKTSWISSILESLSINPLCKISKQETANMNRGAGLYINKLNMQNIGGDIVVKETSKEGTTFAINIPIKYFNIEEFKQA